ncbi:cytochrome P450 [Actinokineospora sp. NBRC 105648]|uniref:cytochrome P450 family protein n=1 Tax=Actinokineospora sp. NBRC 105648 TaxID=3032206 RepID=UPI00249FC914|nr:cytochrome P450 [Actinokineospora sp. NBRC 105648]GLZ42138.1 cytochrome P450 [Actinokineospora sp. NBRC 105648]
MSLREDVLRLDEGFFQDPYALYDELRETGPVRQVLMPQGVYAWLVTRYADARAALADPRLSKDVAAAGTLMQTNREPGSRRPEFGGELAAHMLNMDPPDHTRLRKLVNRAFTARGIEPMRARVQQITDGLLDALAERGEVDLIAEFAFPLPMTVICELLGVPDADRESFRGWTSTVTSTAPFEQIQAAGMAMAEYLVKLLAHKRTAPGDDLLTALIETSEDGDRLSEVELVSMTFLLLLAGHETTVNLISNSVLALLRNPEQLAALRADPGLLPGAIEEFLRYEGPINLATMRYTTEPVDFDGIEVPANEFVLVSLGAANRDPERFPEADRLDVARAPSAHLAFGHGIHYCVGAPLARMEGEIALGSLLRRFPDLALAGDPVELVWRESTIVRALDTLPVRLSATPIDPVEV